MISKKQTNSLCLQPESHFEIPLRHEPPFSEVTACFEAQAFAMPMAFVLE
jgi:hypothetical protein